jgi:hypothetical protein
MDCFTFGTILYFMVGLAPTAGYYFTFMGVIITFSVLMNEFLFTFATISKTKADVQVIAACLVLFFILFCGFIIPPNVIPDYFVWIYWYNPLAWAYRALLVNEYRSSFYSTEEGDQILEFIGLVDLNGNPMGREWVVYGLIYMLCHICLTFLLSAIGLSKNRITGQSGAKENEEVFTEQNGTETESFRISFKPVALSFENICYDVTTSNGNGELRLLHDVNGAFKAGKCLTEFSRTANKLEIGTYSLSLTPIRAYVCNDGIQWCRQDNTYGCDSNEKNIRYYSRGSPAQWIFARRRYLPPLLWIRRTV